MRDAIFPYVAIAFEILGAAAISLGFLLGIVLSARALARREGGQAAYRVLRNTLGGAILLGLEVLVAADLLRTVTTDPQLEDILVLGLVIVIRGVLSVSIQIEMEGVVPWRRALLHSGGHVLADAVKQDRAASAEARGSDTDR